MYTSCKTQSNESFVHVHFFHLVPGINLNIHDNWDKIIWITKVQENYNIAFELFSGKHKTFCKINTINILDVIPPPILLHHFSYYKTFIVPFYFVVFKCQSPYLSWITLNWLLLKGQILITFTPDSNSLFNFWYLLTIIHFIIAANIKTLLSMVIKNFI